MERLGGRQPSKRREGKLDRVVFRHIGFRGFHVFQTKNTTRSSVSYPLNAFPVIGNVGLEAGKKNLSDSFLVGPGNFSGL